jgi:alpha-tubulin suppressor-like RCC1 family protein
MLIKFQGLNVSSKKAESFEIDNVLRYNNESEIIANFDNFYLTFDSIYYYSAKFQSIFIFNFKSKKFEILNERNNDSKVVTLSSNSNYLFCLILNSKELTLAQYSAKILRKQFRLENLVSFDKIERLVLASTDINTYLFDNGINLKCVLNLNDFEQTKDQKKLESELQLNENSTSSLPAGLVLLDEKCELVSTGKEHLIFRTTASQKLYSLGVGLKGQLGNGKIENCFNEVQCINLKDVSLVQSGGWHSGVIDTSGDCFMWGWNSSGQIGVTEVLDSSNDAESVFVPNPTKICIRDFNDEIMNIKFKRLSLGARHSALISIDNCVYVFGWNKYKQLCLDSQNCSLSQNDSDCEMDETIEEPRRLPRFDSLVFDVKCGCWFTLLMTSF